MTEIPITEEDIARLVPRFYARVRRDAVLGPIFDNAIDFVPTLYPMFPQGEFNISHNRERERVRFLKQHSHSTTQ